MSSRAEYSDRGVVSVARDHWVKSDRFEPSRSERHRRLDHETLVQ